MMVGFTWFVVNRDRDARELAGRWALVADAVVRRGWPVVYLYERGADEIFSAIVHDAARQGAEAHATRFAQAADRQIAVAPAWGLLNGRCTDRVVAEIERLASR